MRRLIATTAVLALSAASMVVLAGAPATANGQTAGERFVQAAFADFLNRAPSPSELSSIGLTITLDPATRDHAVSGLVTSPEYVSAVVQKLYRDTLGRDGDPAGVAYWTDQIRSGARSFAQVASNFYGSDEYETGIGGGTPRSWITDLYRKLLHRDPDQPGLDYWTAQVTATNRPVIALHLFQSSESLRTRITDRYLALLGRPADADGLTYWPDRLRTDGDLALARNLADSSEYLRFAQVRFSLELAPPDLANVPDGKVGTPYAFHVGTTGGRSSGPYLVSATGLPPGLTLSATGDLAGTPTQAGTFAVTFRTSDPHEPTSTVTLTRPISVAPADPPGCVPAGRCTQLTHGDAPSHLRGMSRDGRYLLVSSEATDLVPGSDNPGNDVFLVDRVAGTTTRVTDGPGGVAGSLSADGRFVAYSTSVSGASGTTSAVLVWDRTTGTSTTVHTTTDPRADGAHTSSGGVVSADGRYVAFQSDDPSLPGAGSTARAYLWDRNTGAISAFGPSDAPAAPTSTSDDGRFITLQIVTGFPLGSGPLGWKVALFDRVGGTLRTIAVPQPGGPDADGLAPTVSGDGNHVVFWSVTTASPSAHLYAWDRSSQALVRLTEPVTTASVRPLDPPGQSVDGRFVTFATSALLAGDTAYYFDQYLLDRRTGGFTRATASGDGASGRGFVTDGGDLLAFESLATDLAAPGPSTSPQVYLWTRPPS